MGVGGVVSADPENTLAPPLAGQVRLERVSLACQRRTQMPSSTASVVRAASRALWLFGSFCHFCRNPLFCMGKRARRIQRTLDVLAVLGCHFALARQCSRSLRIKSYKDTCEIIYTHGEGLRHMKPCIGEGMNGHEKSAEILHKLSPNTVFQYERTVESSVTTKWGVQWDETMIARDIMQNFYDANRGQVNEIKISHTGGTVEITAPASFNLDRLLFLGSEKGSEDVGEYGEGFKAAAVCLLRGHVTPVAYSDNRVLCLRVAEEPAQNTDLYPLMYDFFTSETHTGGTRLLLLHCPKKQADELKKGLHHFLYPDNPLLGNKLWSNSQDDFEIYESKDGTGHVFYRSLKRGEIDGIPVILVLNKGFKSIDNKIGNDRDRKAFGGDLMELLYKRFVQSGLNYDFRCQGKRALVEAARSQWKQGHPLLHAIANDAAFPRETVDSIFGDKYFAKSPAAKPGDKLRYETIEQTWIAEDRQALPMYFAQMGLISAERYCRQLDEQAKKESLERDAWPPSPAELECIGVLKRILRDFAPEIVGALGKYQVNYTVAETESLLGELIAGHTFLSREVFLAASVFLSDFANAVATFLHEHAHIFGCDGSRGFTDALTELLGTLIAERESLDEYDRLWKAAQRNVIKERKKMKRETKESELDKRVAGMGEKELRKLVHRVPPLVLKRLLDKH